MDFTSQTDAVIAAESLDALERLRLALFGKKGEITEQLKALGALPAEDRKERGRELNVWRDRLARALDERKAALLESEENARLESERIDITLPARGTSSGSLHPISRVLEEIAGIFAEQGFGVRTGPLVERDDYNFTLLNIPESHPARQMHDTFYVRGEETESSPGDAGRQAEAGETKYVLRTHTSPVQVRTMLSEKPPIRIIAPGSTFRNESDLTHTPMFHQIEGLVIDKGIHMGHLKGCVSAFLRRFFALHDLNIRFRPSFFPFTEPSAEVDIGCERSRDSLKIGEGTDWLEVMGCGMVHPNVLRNCGIDPDEWQGFAFGAGIERLAMLKYNIPDVRTFYESDQRWLDHYGFSPFDPSR